ncbi:MAG: CbiQ family ECF transporter T component, partial [Acidimicrobiia bacterium]
MGAGHAHALYVHEHSPIHRLAPEAKLAAVFVFVFAVAVTPREAIWAFLAYGAMLVAVVRIARLRARFVLARLLAILPFIAFAFLIPFVASGEHVEVLGVSVSREGLWGTWNIVAKATIGATA